MKPESSFHPSREAARGNPGLTLGVLLGTLAEKGRDKVTIIASPGLRPFGAWLEQLLAESTGKEGRGLIPVYGEPLGPPGLYGNDRLFVYLKLDSETDEQQERAVEILEQAGHAVVRVVLEELYNLGQEFFRWEIAVAVAASVMGVNPFNQPDVEASKAATRELSGAYEKTGAFPAEIPLLEEEGIALFADEKNSAALAKEAGGDRSSLSGLLRAHLDRAGPGDYIALLAYIEMNDAHEEELRNIRQAARDRKSLATCLGFGPRFLHSTGQVFKGGPATGVFLQITCDDGIDLPVPGRRYTFGVVKGAQARGDQQVLEERGRRILRAHMKGGVKEGLAKLRAAVTEALA